MNHGEIGTDDARIWEGLRRHLDDLGRVAPVGGLADVTPWARPSRRRNLGTAIGLPVVLATFAVVAVLVVARHVPSASPGQTAEPTLTAKPQIDPLAGVAITCEAPRSAPSSSPDPTCHQVISAVLGVIPAEPMKSVLLGFPSGCAIGARCAFVPTQSPINTNAFVLVDWSEGNPAVIVRVTFDQNGGFTIGPPQTLIRLPDVPVDTSLEAVSRTSLTASAKVALNLCVAPANLDQVVGMARLPANQVHRFTLTNGREPELQTDALVWAIQLKGLLPERASDAWIDPLCVVVQAVPPAFPLGATRYQFLPYGTLGEFFSPPRDFVWPEAALPSLAP